MDNMDAVDTLHVWALRVNEWGETAPCSEGRPKHLTAGVSDLLLQRTAKVGGFPSGTGKHSGVCCAILLPDQIHRCPE